VRSLFRLNAIIVALALSLPAAEARDYHVAPGGNDETGDGSLSKPWQSIAYACNKVPPQQGHVIKIKAGIYTEKTIYLPPGVSLAGEGTDKTIISASPDIFYNPIDPGFGYEHFLLQLKSSIMAAGNQYIRNIGIEGKNKRAHGGILIDNRSHVVIQQVSISHFNFSGIWVWQASNVQLRGIHLFNCAWGSSGWCSGALQLSNSAHVEVSDFTIDENKGYGIKNLGHIENTPFTDIKIHDGRITVEPRGAWNNGQAPNISIELWASSFPQTEIYNCYVDNHISLVNHPQVQAAEPLRLHHNIFDIAGPRAQGNGYCLELSISNVEIYNNWFNGGTTGIVNWGDRMHQNWNVHHNTFFAISSPYPTSVLNFYKGGITSLAFYNNTIETTQNSIVSLLELNNGAVGIDILLKNNLAMNGNTGSDGHPTKLVSLLQGAGVRDLTVENNFLQGFSIGDSQGRIQNNAVGDPGITRHGLRPYPFYSPTPSSPLIDAGQDVGLPFIGTAPDVGAYETSGKH
jgi:hypothetical protein